MKKQGSKVKTENDLLKNINWSAGSRLWLAFLFACLAFTLYFYVVQLRDGLGVTGMRDYVSWGLYISNFVFFVAVSLIGMLISSAVGLAGHTWVIPIGRIAEIIAVSFAVVAGLVVITDMGRPDRLHHILTDGRVQSPILWDVGVVATYSVMSLLLLYIPLIPDLALCGKKLTGLPKLQVKIYRLLSLGWANKPEQFAILKKTIRIVLIAIVPVALSIHTVTSWLFALTLRPSWNSTLFGPYFVAGAFVAGCAALIVLIFFFQQKYQLHDYITDLHFDRLGKLLVLTMLIYAYFNVNEMLVPGYKPGSAAANHVADLLIGHEAVIFWMVQVLGLIIPILLLTIGYFRKPLPIAIISSVVLVAAWFKRYLIVIPAQSTTYFPIQNVSAEFMHYSPTFTEVAVTIAPVIIVLIIITLLAKTVPLVPIWEISEHSDERK